MREILFRGKAKAGYKWISEGEWIEGSLFYSDNENGIVCQIATSYLSNNKDEPVMVAAYEVDPETVCQYTGLTDKNGRKIFEGDIVECRARKDGHDKYKVIWCKDYADFRIEPLDFGVQFPITDCGGEYIRGGKYSVIGNILDNPELTGE